MMAFLFLLPLCSFPLFRGAQIPLIYFAWMISVSRSSPGFKRFQQSSQTGRCQQLKEIAEASNDHQVKQLL